MMSDNSQSVSEASSPVIDINKRPSYMEITTSQPIQTHFDDRVVRCLENQFNAYADDEEAEPIKTYLRIRPYAMKRDDEFKLLEIKDDKTVIANYEAPGNRGRSKLKKMEFKFTKVLDGTCSQERVFEESISPLLDQFDMGESCLVFSYGATNSGKTYTMRGSSTKYGIIPRTLFQIFDRHQERIYKGGDIQPFRHESTRALPADHQKLIFERKKALIENVTETLEMKQRPKAPVIVLNHSDASSHCVAVECIDVNASFGANYGADGNGTLLSMWVSFVELYNEKCYDLLSMAPGAKRTEVKLVSEKAGSYSYFKDITEIPVFSEVEAYALYVAGYKRLEVSATQMNQSSSRSHSFFTIRVVELGRTSSSVYPIKVHRITFCDLAGCERISQTENTGGQLRESANINQSLLSLLKVIRMIRNKQSHKQSFLEKIPFRENKLTRIFQGYFTTSTHIAMIVNVNPVPKMADSSIQTLTNSAIASNIVAFRPKPQVIVQAPHNTSFLHSTMDLEDVLEEDEENEDMENLPPPSSIDNLPMNNNNHNHRDENFGTPRRTKILGENNNQNVQSPATVIKKSMGLQNQMQINQQADALYILQMEKEDLMAQLREKDDRIKHLTDQVLTVESETREQMLKETQKMIQAARNLEQRRKMDWSDPRSSQFSSRLGIKNTVSSSTQTE